MVKPIFYIPFGQTNLVVTVDDNTQEVSVNTQDNIAGIPTLAYWTASGIAGSSNEQAAIYSGVVVAAVSAIGGFSDAPKAEAALKAISPQLDSLYAQGVALAGSKQAFENIIGSLTPKIIPSLTTLVNNLQVSPAGDIAGIVVGLVAVASVAYTGGNWQKEFSKQTASFALSKSIGSLISRQTGAILAGNPAIIGLDALGALTLAKSLGGKLTLVLVGTAAGLGAGYIVSKAYDALYKDILNGIDSEADNGVQSQLVLRGLWVVQPGDTYASIAAQVFIDNLGGADLGLDAVTPGLIARLNGIAYSPASPPIPTPDQVILVPIQIFSPGTTVGGGGLENSNQAYYYDLSTGELIDTSSKADGSNTDTITVLNEAGGTIDQFEDGTVTKITLNTAGAVFTLGDIPFTVDDDGSRSIQFGDESLPISSTNAITIKKLGDPTYLIDVSDSEGNLAEQITYGSDGTDELTTFRDTDGEPLLSQDTEYADGTSVITAVTNLGYVTTDYSGPDGTGTILDPTYASTYANYFWQAGSGLFADATKWAVPGYDPDAQPPEPQPGPPGYNSNVSFGISGVVVTGPGNANVVTITASITFAGIIQVYEVYNQGSLDVQGSLILSGQYNDTYGEYGDEAGTGALSNSGQLSVEGEVDGPDASVANYGSGVIQDGGYLDVSFFGEDGGTWSVLAGSELAVDGIIAIIGGGTLTVDGINALVSVGGATGIDNTAGSSFIGKGTGVDTAGGAIVVSDQGQFIADSIEIGEDVDGTAYGGTLTIESGGGATANGNVDTSATATITVDGAGSELDAGFIGLANSGDASGAGNSAVASLSVLDGAAVTTNGLQVGLNVDGGSAASDVGTVTVDGAGSELDLGNSLIVYLGTITVSDAATLNFGVEASDQTGFFDVEPDNGFAGYGSLIVEGGGQFIAADTLPDDSQTILGDGPTDQGSATVTGANSLLDLGETELIVGNAGTGILAISDDGEVDAGEIDIANQSNSTGTISVDGADSVLFGDSLNVGIGGGGALSITNAGTVSVSDVEVGSSGSVTLVDGSLVTDPLTVDSGGLISGYGTLFGDIIDNGTIIATGGLLDLTDDVSGSGTLEIANGATLELDGTLAAGLTVAFDAPDAILNLGTTPAGIGAVSALGLGVGVFDGDTATDTLTIGTPSQAATAIVDGDGTTVNMTGALIVYSGTVTVSDSAAVYLDEQFSGNPTGSSQGLFFDIGTSGGLGGGNGTLIVESGGQVEENGTSDGDGLGIFGDGVSDQGSGIVTGPGSGLELSLDTFIVGNAGSGTLLVSDGGFVAAGEFDIAAEQTTDVYGDVYYSQGAVTVQDVYSLLIVTTLWVGGSSEGPGGYGTLTIADDGQVYANDAEVWNGSSAILAGGMLETNFLSVDGTLAGYGSISGELYSYGGITASGGLLDVSSYVAGGILTIADGAALQFDAQVTSAVTVQFAGTAGVLNLGDPADAQGTITGFVAGDTIDLINNEFETGDQVNLISGNILQITEVSGGVFDLQLDPYADYSTSVFDIGSDSASGTDITVACYAAGTRIATARGEVVVEALRVGDAVQTLLGGTKPIKWIGYRRIDCRRYPDPDKVWPVRVRVGAFGEGMPRRDLWLSPDHAVFVDGALIPIRQLINHATIAQPETDTVRYFHIELDRHDVLLAEGLPAESYLDTGNRAAFENAGIPMTLYPDFSRTAGSRGTAASCAPLITQADRVEPIWRRLAARSSSLGHCVSFPAVTHEPQLRLAVAGRTIRPVETTKNRHIFVLLPLADRVRITSRAAAPSRVRPWLDDRRRLGVSVERIVLHDRAGLTEMPVDHPALSDGWYEAERDGYRQWRWTDGSARLPVPGGTTMITISLAGCMEYPVSEAAERGAHVLRAGHGQSEGLFA